MSNMLNDGELLSVIHGIGAQITAALKALLTTKHLYQSVRVEYEQLIGAVAPRLPPQYAPELGKALRNVASGRWYVNDPLRAPTRWPLSGDDDSKSPTVHFDVPDVKLFCTQCSRLEAFNVVSGEDFLGRETRATDYGEGTKIVQVFVFSFLCQSCKTIPEVFLVRRDGTRLMNTGRAPIEAVQAPGEIPKSVSQFFSGAIVAHQSGQTLAGLFLLRTLVEQHARDVTKRCADVKVDEILEAYLGTLPSDFRGRFATLKSTYSELSADIHSATGSVELFDKASSEIREHFEARRLFKLG